MVTIAFGAVAQDDKTAYSYRRRQNQTGSTNDRLSELLFQVIRK